MLTVKTNPKLNVSLSPFGGIRVSIDDCCAVETFIDLQESFNEASACAQIEYDQEQARLASEGDKS